MTTMTTTTMTMKFLNVDWRRALIQSAMLFVIVIVIPLLALPFNGNALQPVDAKGFNLVIYLYSTNNDSIINCFTFIAFPITVVLQGSISLLITQVR